MVPDVFPPSFWGWPCPSLDVQLRIVFETNKQAPVSVEVSRPVPKVVTPIEPDLTRVRYTPATPLDLSTKELVWSRAGVRFADAELNEGNEVSES